MKKLLSAFLGLALAIGALIPRDALAATGPNMSGWTTSNGVTYRTFSNSAGIDRVEFSSWDRMGENNLQFASNLTLENAGISLDNTVFEQTKVDGGGEYDCIVVQPGVSASKLKSSVVMLHWPTGAYLQDGTAVPVTMALTNFTLAVKDPAKLKAPLRVIRTVPAQTIQLEAFYNGADGVDANAGTGVSCTVNVSLDVPAELPAAHKSMIFTATDLDIADAGDYEGSYAESVTFGAGVLGTVYLEDKTYKDFDTQASSTTPLYGTAADGRFINVERLVESGGTRFSSSRKTDGAEQVRAAGLATLVDAEYFSFTWKGNNCGTALFLQAGLSPRLTVGNVGSYPHTITTTDEQFAQTGQAGLAQGLYVNPTNAERHSHSYKVHWKSQKTIHAKADPGYRLTQVQLDPAAAHGQGASVDLTALAPGQTVTVGASTITLNADGTATVSIADKNNTGVGDARAYMTDHVVLFASEPDTVDVSVRKEWTASKAASATVELLRGDEVVAQAQLSEANAWQHVFRALPRVEGAGVAYDYRVREVPVLGYVGTVVGDAQVGFVITNAESTETVAVSGTKEWRGDEGNEGARPQSITLRLHADGAPTGHVTTTSASQGWRWEFVGLPRYAQGKEIRYTVTEDAVLDYTTVYEGVDGRTVVNTYAPETTSVTASKAWRNADGTPMENTSDLPAVSVQLLSRPAGSDDFAPVEGQVLTLSEDNAWRGSFVGLPLRDDGVELEYAVAEQAVAGYDTAVTGDAATGFVITNTQRVYQVFVDKLAEDTGSGLAGALLVVSDAAGVEVASWHSDGTPMSLTLLPGSYTLQEVLAPEGYLLADPVAFEVLADGTLNVGGTVVDAVRMVDPVLEPVVPEANPGGGPDSEPESDDPSEGEPETDNLIDDLPTPSTGTPTNTAAPRVTSTSRSADKLAATGDATLPVLFYTVAAVATLAFALVLRRMR